MFTSAAKKYRTIACALVVVVGLFSAFLFAKNKYSNTDFGAAFHQKAKTAQAELSGMEALFETCAPICNADPAFMQAIVFPEVMRYNILKDGMEAESLRTLYVQFGKEYADFSIGLFQMKPSFAEEVEQKSVKILPQKIQQELQLAYAPGNDENIRIERIQRMQDKEWQLIYLTAFIGICNELYKTKSFHSPLYKLQWYATVYNAGFNRTDNYISQKVNEDNFYLQQDMPGKEFKYAAVAGWYFENHH